MTAVSRALVSVALIAAGVVLAAPHARAMAVPGYNGRIAFVRAGVGMMTVTPDGLGDIHLEQDLHVAGGPAGWSSDGTRLGYGGVDDEGIVTFNTMDALGIVRTAHFADNHAGFAWSPDGARVAGAMWDESVGSRIIVRDIDGTNQSVLLPTDRTDRNNGPDAAPSWSPDSQSIAFESTTSGVRRIWNMKADGSDAHEVPGQPDGASRQPAFSPDGKRVVFVSDPTEANAFGRLFVVGVDGSDPLPIGPTDRYVGWPQFSPDGTQIVFSSFGENYTADEAAGLYVVDSDGTNQHRITWHADAAPMWQPLSVSLPNLPARALGGARQAPARALFGNADSSFDADGTIVKYEWRWGDNTAMTPRKYAWHRYARAGTYLVRLTVTDNDGARTTKRAWVKVS